MEAVGVCKENRHIEIHFICINLFHKYFHDDDNQKPGKKENLNTLNVKIFGTSVLLE